MFLEGTPIHEHIAKGHSSDLTAKRRIFDCKWYSAAQNSPEILGTDKLACQNARFFPIAISLYEIEFIKQQDVDSKRTAQ